MFTDRKQIKVLFVNMTSIKLKGSTTIIGTHLRAPREHYILCWYDVNGVKALLRLPFRFLIGNINTFYSLKKHYIYYNQAHPRHDTFVTCKFNMVEFCKVKYSIFTHFIFDTTQFLEWIFMMLLCVRIVTECLLEVCRSPPLVPWMVGALTLHKLKKSFVLSSLNT